MRIFTLTNLLLLLLLSGCASTPDGDLSYEWSEQRYFDEARIATDSGNYQLALNYYSQLEAKYPYGKLTQQSQLETIFVHFRNSEPEAAIAAADRFIKLNPRHPKVDYAYYMRGLASYDLDANMLEEWMDESRSERDPQGARDSFAYFKELITRYPNSKYRKDALDRMAKIRNSLAKYEIAVADFYLRRGAYVAAVNRAKYVVENYPKTNAINDALRIMNMGYQKLEMNKLDEDAKRIIELNKINK